MASTFYNTPVFAESISAVTATPSVQLGAVRHEAGDVYTYVYNDGGSQISIGYGCIISANSGYSVTVSSTTNSNGFFGAVKHTTFTTATYGWMLTRGFVGIKAPAGSGIAAAAILGVGADGVFTDVPVTGVAAVPQGYAVGATASAGIGVGYVRLFGA